MEKKYNEKTDWKYLLGGTVAIFGFIGACGNVVNMVENGAVTHVSGAILAAQVASFAVPAAIKGIKYYNQKSEDRRMEQEAQRQRMEQREIDRNRKRQEGINWNTPEIRAKREREEEVKKWKEEIRAKSNLNTTVDKYADVKGRIDQEKKYIDSLIKAGKGVTFEDEKILFDICAKMTRMEREEARKNREDQENGTTRTTEAIQRRNNVENQLAELRAQRAEIYKMINNGLLRNYGTTQTDDDGR